MDHGLVFDFHIAVVDRKFAHTTNNVSKTVANRYIVTMDD